MGEDREGEIALELANDMHTLAQGKPTASVLMALGMMLGWSEAQAERPDVDGLLRILRGLIEEEMARHLANPEGP